MMVYLSVISHLIGIMVMCVQDLDIRIHSICFSILIISISISANVISVK